MCLFAATPSPGESENASRLPYIRAKAYHVLPGTHNNESGYFSLCEGLDGKMYIGTTRYGENSHLVRFDPVAESQRMVLDTHELCGLTDIGYAAQAKIHSRNDVGDSGRIYCGSYQGYRKKGDISEYKGGYVMVYDPKTDTAEHLGIPHPGEGVADIVADEKRGLLYIVTSMKWRWMLYEVKSKNYRPLNVLLTPLARTMIDARGRANAFTEDFKLAQFEPDTGQVTIRPIEVDGRNIADLERASWTHVSDPARAYMVTTNHEKRQVNLWMIDLLSEGHTVKAEFCATLMEGEHLNCNCGLDLGPDGRVYAVVRAERNAFRGDIEHLTRYDPKSGQAETLGIITVGDPTYVERASTAPDGSRTASHGFRNLPDGTLAPKGYHLALIVARDGTVYLTYLYPFTLLRIDAIP